MPLMKMKPASVFGLTRVIWQRYIHHLDKNPARMHAFNTCLLMSAGDVIAQLVLERRTLTSYDFERTSRFAAVGLLMAGPGMHVWYRALDRLVIGPGKGPVAFKKMLADQALFLPFYLAVFVSTMGILRGDNPRQIKEKLRRDFRPMLATSYSIWPAVQMVNFYLVPLKHRILVINIVCLLWNSYIGWKAEKELIPEVEIPTPEVPIVMEIVVS